MKILLFFTGFLLAVMAGHTQQLHFAYLQTDTHQPFYVALNKKNYSSTTSGYIILPKLQTGDYPLRIGFARAEGAEQEYILQVKDNDQGFLIKDFGEKGWGLFNLQTMAVQYAGTVAQERAKLAAAEKAEADLRQRKLQEEQEAADTQRRNDSLKAVAATRQSYNDSVAVNAALNRQRNDEDSVAKENNTAQQKREKDSITNERALAKENERLQKIADSTARVQAAIIEKEKATVAVLVEKDNGTTTLPDNPVPQTKVPVKKIPVPVLIHQLFTDSGWHYAYNITNNNQREMVDVFIPSAQPKPPAETTAAAVENTVTPVTAEKQDSVKFLNISIGQDTTSGASKEITINTNPSNQPVIAGNAVSPQTEIADSIPVAAEKPSLNPNCREEASEKDFFTARKKLASAIGTAEMLVAAQKILKQKCYTTEQLRNLCVLFLTDVGRYQFLDAAYPFASDAYRYHLLQDLLIDNYYVQRFKAMLR